MDKELAAEHERLLEQTRQLEHEHRRLEQSPNDLEGHVEHRAKLKAQIEELHAHMRRLQERIPPPPPETS